MSLYKYINGQRVQMSAEEEQTTRDSWNNPPLPKQSDVNAERDRRLDADFAFQGKLYQRDSKSLSRITGAATLAGFAIANGAQPGDYRWHGGDTDFEWIASDNSLTKMDAQTAFQFGQVAANVETRIVFAAKSLREMDPIPVDYDDDARWPS